MAFRAIGMDGGAGILCSVQDAAWNNHMASEGVQPPAPTWNTELSCGLLALGWPSPSYCMYLGTKERYVYLYFCFANK